MKQINPTSQKYLSNTQILGIEPSHDRPWEQFVVCKQQTGRKVVYVVPVANKNTVPYVFADLKYFAILDACNNAGFNCHHDKNGEPIWPYWYIDIESAQYKTFLARYSELMNKYDK